MPEEKSDQYVVVRFGRPVTEDDLAMLRSHEDVIEVVLSVLGHRVLDYTLRVED
jgi:hypothetical protein